MTLPSWMAPTQAQPQGAGGRAHMASLYGNDYVEDSREPVPSLPDVHYPFECFGEPATQLSDLEIEALYLRSSELQQMYNLRQVQPKLGVAMQGIHAEVGERAMAAPAPRLRPASLLLQRPGGRYR